MMRRAAKQAEHDAMVRLKLREAQHSVIEALGLLEEQS
jgi:hypothetical protein